MELKEFVAKTLDQILTGVNEVNGSSVAKIADGNSDSEHTKNVDFFVTVAFETKSAETIIVDLAGQTTANREHVSRLEFSIPIEFTES